MHIHFPTSAKVASVSNPDNSPTKARDTATVTQAPVAAVSDSDAKIISAAEAALKADSKTDSRINDIRQAIQAGLIRFDAEALAANILRYHGKQD